MDNGARDLEKVLGQYARRIDVLEREVRELRKAPPSVTPSRPHPQIWDDFGGGSDVSGNIGELGWTLGGGAATRVAPQADHPGLIKLDTGAGAGTLAPLHVGASTSLGYVQVSNYWTVRFVVGAGSTVDANTHIRVGLAMNPQLLAPAQGVYIEKLITDTTFYGVCRATGVQTRSQILTSTGAAMTAVTANRWYRFRVRRLSSTSAGFTVEEPATGRSYPEVVIGTNVPTTINGLQLVIQVQNGAVAASRFVYVDFAECQFTNLGR